jgi:hypothetical protein
MPLLNGYQALKQNGAGENTRPVIVQLNNLAPLGDVLS